MDELPQNLYTAAQMQRLDRMAIDEAGIDGYELMCRAGAAAFDALRRHWPQARQVLVCCGKGNNGGDGYVIARLALEAGLQARVLAMALPEALAGDAARAASDWVAAGGEVTLWTEQSDALEAMAPEVVVDALFGTGLERPVEGRWRHLIEALNAGNWGRLAVDIPSGLSADTGGVLGVAVQADVTATFIGLKRGLFTADGPQQVGQLVYDDLAVPAEVYTREQADLQRVGSEEVAAALAPRPRNAHKGHFGHVLVVGGAPGMSGAARMAGEAAQRVGAGLVSVATAPAHAAMLNVDRPELMCAGVGNARELAPLLARATVVALGPGLGQGAWGRAMFAAVSETRLPVVMDADALNLLAADPVENPDRIMTPHPGEAGRLLGCDAGEINRDRFAAVAALVDRYGGVAVLKGVGTLIGDQQHSALVDRGNPGMASGGMGDVLTGVIAGLLAQGVAPFDAARLGAWLHGRAAELAASDGQRGLLASDLFAPLRQLVNP